MIWLNSELNSLTIILIYKKLRRLKNRMPVFDFFTSY